jgi:hypothetical protein
MKNITVLAVSCILGLTAAELGSQPAPQDIRGVWQMTEVTITGPNARVISSRDALLIVAGGYYSFTRVTTDQPRPEPKDYASATADELRAVWGPFTANAGAYELSAETLTTRPMVAKNPAFVRGGFAVYSYRLDGNTLTLTEQRTRDGPVTNPATYKYTRLE